MSVTRTRIRCRERACPWRDDEEFHAVPWCRGIEGHKCFGGVTHQHWPKRSQGGKEIVALLCSGAHDIIDNGSRFSNDVVERDGERIYRILHEKRGVLYERDIGAATGEGESEARLAVSRGRRHGVCRIALPSPAGVSPELAIDAGRDSQGDSFTAPTAAVTPPSVPSIVIDRIWKRVEKTDTCWLWQGGLSKSGYGLVGQHRKNWRVHRVVYEHLVGAIPAGLVLDHICRVKTCVNPEHLRAVTDRDNVLAAGSASVTAANARKTHCPQGHPYDLLNTYINPNTSNRQCRTCYRERKRHLRGLTVRGLRPSVAPEEQA